MDFLRRLVFSIWYYFRPPWDTGISPPELVEFLDSHPPGRALDLGCGTGTNAIEMARRGWQVVGVDFAASAIRRARRKARSAGVVVDFRVEDVARLNGFDSNFELILDIGCLHGLPEADRQQTMDHVASLLGQSGTYLLYAMLRAGDGDPGPGLLPGDLDRLSDRFTLMAREDGLNRRTRPSAWLAYSPKKD